MLKTVCYQGTDIWGRGQKLKMLWKDIPGLIKKILENPDFKDNLHYEGEVLRLVMYFWFECCTIVGLTCVYGHNRVDLDDPESERMFGDMHTGVWMQKARLVVGDTQTPIGIVLYSDKTHALQGMQVYPLYSKFIFYNTCTMPKMSFH